MLQKTIYKRSRNGNREKKMSTIEKNEKRRRSKNVNKF